MQIIQPTSEPSICESHDQGADHAKLNPKSSELSNEQHHQDQQHAGPGVDVIADPLAQVDAVLDDQELLGNLQQSNRNDINLARKNYATITQPSSKDVSREVDQRIFAQETACGICGVTLANCAHASKPYQSLDIVERQAQEQRKKKQIK